MIRDNPALWIGMVPIAVLNRYRSMNTFLAAKEGLNRIPSYSATPCQANGAARGEGGGGAHPRIPTPPENDDVGGGGGGGPPLRGYNSYSSPEELDTDDHEIDDDDDDDDDGNQRDGALRIIPAKSRTVGFYSNSLM